MPIKLSQAAKKLSKIIHVIKRYEVMEIVKWTSL